MYRSEMFLFVGQTNIKIFKNEMIIEMVLNGNEIKMFTGTIENITKTLLEAVISLGLAFVPVFWK